MEHRNLTFLSAIENHIIMTTGHQLLCKNAKANLFLAQLYTFCHFGKLQFMQDDCNGDDDDGNMLPELKCFGNSSYPEVSIIRNE